MFMSILGFISKLVPVIIMVISFIYGITWLFIVGVVLQVLSILISTIASKLLGWTLEMIVAKGLQSGAVC